MGDGRWAMGDAKRPREAEASRGRSLKAHRSKLIAQLHRQQPREERAIALQRLTEVLRRDVAAAVPLALELCALVGEGLGEPLDRVGHQAVGALDRAARLVDEAGLDLGPLALKLVDDVGREQRRVARRAHVRWRAALRALDLAVADLALEINRGPAGIAIGGDGEIGGRELPFRRRLGTVEGVHVARVAVVGHGLTSRSLRMSRSPTRSPGRLIGISVPSASRSASRATTRSESLRRTNSLSKSRATMRSALARPTSAGFLSACSRSSSRSSNSPR